MRNTLYYVALALVAGCVRTTEPDLSAPTPWEIQSATSVDDGTAYWPGAAWRTAFPSQVGLDSTAMANLSRDLRGGRWPTVRSLLIVRHGYLVLNEYAGDATPELLQPMQSMTATVTGLLVGIAAREGRLRPSDGALQFFPDYQNRGRGWYVDDLLTMRSGIDFNEEDNAPPSLRGLLRSGDWIRYIFDAGITTSSGERWHYSSADAILLGGVLRSATDEPANVYARHALFAPLGITNYAWVTGQPDGLPQMGGGLSLTAPDMARLGYLLLRKGQWGDTPIVTPAWVASMSERKSPTVARWKGYTLDFGRMLWQLPCIPGTTDFGVVAAAGIRGQWIIVAPSRDLVVVTTGDAQSVEEHATALELLYDVILPAAH